MPNIYLSAGEDLTGFEKRFVCIDGNGDAIKPTNGGDATGVLTAGADVGEQVTIAINSTATVETDGVVPARRMIATTAEGKCRVAQQGEIAHGTSSEAATVGTTEIGVELQRFGTVSGPVDSDGSQVVTASGPRTSDNKPIVIASQFNGSVRPVFSGVGDNIASGVRFDGELFQMESDRGGGEVRTQDWQHMEWLYIAGGMVAPVGGTLGDWFTYEIVAPASPATSNPGAGAYDKADIGGGVNVFVPNGTITGDWDLDISAKLNANVGFSAVVPVPSSTQTGAFDWDPSTELVTPNLAGQGLFNLFDAEIHLVTFAAKLPVGDLCTDLRLNTVKPKRLLAHWIHRVTWNITNPVAPNNVKKSMSWILLGARETT